MKLKDWLIASLGSVVLACGGGESVLDSTDVGRGRSDTGRGTDDDASEASDENKSSPDAGRIDGGTRRRDAGAPSDPSCDVLTISARPNAPDILIVLDRSTSMRSATVDRWGPSMRAVQSITAQLTETVSFGLMTFPAPIVNGCTAGTVSVPVATNSAAQIAATLAISGPALSNGMTPTAATLDAALRALDKNCVDCEGAAPKYVLLVTDGEPTCGSDGSSFDTTADVANTTAAIDRLTAAGIRTYVVGYETASKAAQMNEFAMHGGTERYIPVENERTLVEELTRITAGLVPCEYDLSSEVSDPSFVRVTIDGEQHNLSDGAWRIDGKKIILEKACDVLRDAKVHDLKIVRECTPVEVI